MADRHRRDSAGNRRSKMIHADHMRADARTHPPPEQARELNEFTSVLERPGLRRDPSTSWVWHLCMAGSTVLMSGERSPAPLAHTLPSYGDARREHELQQLQLGPTARINLSTYLHTPVADE